MRQQSLPTRTTALIDMRLWLRAVIFANVGVFVRLGTRRLPSSQVISRSVFRAATGVFSISPANCSVWREQVVPLERAAISANTAPPAGIVVASVCVPTRPYRRARVLPSRNFEGEGSAVLTSGALSGVLLRHESQREYVGHIRARPWRSRGNK